MTNHTQRNSGIVLPAHRVRVFDPVQVFAERVGSRRVVYLDNNLWIELRDVRNPEARACRDACVAAVLRGTVIFPLSYASVNEVVQNPSAEARVAQADLMDSLSFGVTLRSPAAVYAVEGAQAYRYVVRGERVETRRNQAFTGMPDYFGDSYDEFPEGWRPSDVERWMEWRRGDCPARSLRWMVDNLDVELLRRQHAANTADYGARLNDQRALRDAHLGNGRKVTRDDAIHEERAALFKRFALPAIERGLLADLDAGQGEVVARRWIKQPPVTRRRLADVMKTAAPSLELAAQLLGRRSLNAQWKPDPQDFWDIEHASVAPIYADAFVTADGGLATLVRAAAAKLPALKASLLPSPVTLTEWLEATATQP